ncbi:MAG: ATP-binding cassette domain-containing protein [Sutterellaceae bacterium]|nr:ATP-binding cassette domain-containing protein [Burkholderiaceae bacterium]MCX7901648.1 ATP-binding cassette domain-containing protein [Burkholderiaceae bacterium]MDW8430027.1 ATP-binding cassette domain-containing protein [Sutterellaceae bacterium]
MCSAPAAVLVARALRFDYGGSWRLAAPDLQLAAGEHCVLTGPSGSGKTTLLHILAGFLPPHGGEVTLGGQSLYQPPRSDRWRAARIGFVPQRLYLLPYLSALDNVRVAQYLLGQRDDARAREVLAELGLSAYVHARLSELSTGQQQRVAVARAVINGPQLLLADEPTASLDDVAAQAVLDLLLAAAARSGATLIVATHDARVRARLTRVIALPMPPQAA